MFLQVAIRREGNNPWIVLKHNSFISRLARVTTIKRGNVEKITAPFQWGFQYCIRKIIPYFVEN